LGLTTQLPAVPHLVTCGPVPTGLSAVAVSRRNNLARLQLGYTEVAVLELLRDWQTTTQATWGQIVTALRAAIDAGALDTNKLAAAGRCEPHPNVRHDLTALLTDSAQPGQAIA
ncbi:MAG: hypothetical protein WCF12_07375, partial [Propionicimonas sp.]